MNLFVVDTETTGIPSQDPSARMIEFAGILYHVETKAELATVQCLLYSPENPVSHINGITVDTLEVMNPSHEPAKAVKSAAKEMILGCLKMTDYVVAHNAAFDRQFLDPLFGDVKWKCSLNDIQFPNTKNARSLTYLAADHKIFSFAAHRALNDVLTLISLLKLVPDLSEQLSETSEPKTLYGAVGLPFDRKDEAKERGFKWDKDKKLWTKMLKDSELAELPFAIQKI